MTVITEERAYLSKPSAAIYLDCSVDTIERLIAEGTLTPRKLRGHVRISKQELWGSSAAWLSPDVLRRLDEAEAATPEDSRTLAVR